MVKTLFRRDRSDEQTEADPFANGHASENGAAANDSADGGVTPPVETPVQEAPTGPTCATCGAPIQDGQDWCLDCGTALAHGGRGWHIPAVVVGIVLAFAITSTAVAFVAISDDGPNNVTVAENPPPARAAPPAPPAPAPAASTPPPAAPKAPKAPNTTAPPPASTPAPVPATPVPATPVPATPVPVPSTSGGSTSSGSSGSTGSSGSDTSGSSSSGSSGSSNSGGDDLGPSTDQSIPVTLDGDATGIYDPFGDGQQNAADVSNLTDKDKRTTWSTKEYPDASVGKGTGVYMRTASSVAATLLQIRTPEPGFSVNIYGSKDANPPDTLAGWHKLATKTGVSDKQRIQLKTNGTKYRLYLVWITKLPAGRTSATISELELFS